jgi:preprotein translocase SecE subunit
MATAVEPSSAPSAPGKAASLPIASLLGAIYILAALAVVLYTVPLIWPTPAGAGAGDVVSLGRAVVQVLAFIGLLWFGSRIAGETAPRGVRGGAFLLAVYAVIAFFVSRAVVMGVEGRPGQIAGLVVAAIFVAGGVRFFTGQTGRRWMESLEEQGWFSAHQYKRSLGLRVRRLTILGILIVGGTGVYSLANQGLLPRNWTLAMPFTPEPVRLIADAWVFVPVALMALTLWVAWRAVNVPTFAEFLIATEAEMNKVSWSTRRQLAQDTVVVLLTTLILTLFLLVVDLFWGWLLSRNTVGVLPSRSTAAHKGQEVQEQKW